MKETDGGFQDEIRRMLVALGEDPARDGLRRTAARVEAALRWLTSGYRHTSSTTPHYSVLRTTVWTYGDPLPSVGPRWTTSTGAKSGGELYYPMVMQWSVEVQQ